MKRSPSAVLGLLAAALVLIGAGPASAQQASIHDEAGDASGPGLDVTRVSVDNQDSAVVVTVRFVRSVRGDLVVSVDPRGGHGVRMISEYRPVGHTVDLVLGRAFRDHGGSSGEVRCPGLRVHWSAERPTVRLRLPSTCLAGGDYGAIKVDVLTERAGGADTDAAPEGSGLEWVARG